MVAAQSTCDVIIYGTLCTLGTFSCSAVNHVAAAETTDNGHGYSNRVEGSAGGWAGTAMGGVAAIVSRTETVQVSSSSDTRDIVTSIYKTKRRKQIPAAEECKRKVDLEWIYHDLSISNYNCTSYYQANAAHLSVVYIKLNHNNRYKTLSSPPT